MEGKGGEEGREEMERDGGEKDGGEKDDMDIQYIIELTCFAISIPSCLNFSSIVLLSINIRLRLSSYDSTSIPNCVNSSVSFLPSIATKSY